MILMKARERLWVYSLGNLNRFLIDYKFKGLKSMKIEIGKIQLKYQTLSFRKVH